MDEDKIQKELFEFNEPKRPFSSLSKILPKPDIEGKVALTLTLEKMIFIAIGIVMLMVLVYAFGVESGKSRTAAVPAVAAPQVQKTAAQPAQPVPASVQPRATAAAQGQVVIPAVAAQNTAAAQKGFFNTAPAAVAVKAEPAEAASRQFTIVAAAFRKRESAQSALALLARDGFSGSVYYSEPYYLVCVGAYSTKYGTQVQRDLDRIKRTYKDAYVKLK